MPGKRDIHDYLLDIQESIEDIRSFTAGIDYDAFTRDRKTSNAVIRSLEVIGEATKKIPLEIRTQYPEIPWQEIAGMRDKLIHEYFGVDLEVVWTTVQKDLEDFSTAIQEISNQYKIT